ncbi:MAG TPA: NAD-dependent succinate-semialdehyde dehydrogenase, partial [Trueperaceae bacterium]|nr:NAD-dependent succinate-semialdehyde dehydrogenase [Trueperaceae bacterium]
MKQLTDVGSHYLGASWVPLGKTFEVRSPATGQVIADVADCGPVEAASAAAAATEAFAAWRQTTAFERSAVLERWAALMIEHKDELAAVMSAEMGKPIKESRGEVVYAAGFVKWYAEEAKRVYGEAFPSHAGHKRLFALRQPVGPVFAVTPWNFPIAMVTRKAAPALAAGCTLILKPAEQSPLSALLTADLWLEAGGPAGTLQVLPASDPVPLSDALMADDRIRKVTFTGSTEVGKILYRKSADTVKRISLELGGHAPLIVCDDADLEIAVREAIACKYRNSGQTCVCTNRIYVQRGIAQAFTAAFTAASDRLRVGDPASDDTDIGPLVDAQGLDKVKRHLQDALAKGATIVSGGNAVEGLYFEPTVVTDVTVDMLMMQEETFGPVAPIIVFDTIEEAVRLANDTPYGLAAYLFTNDLSRAFKVAEDLEYGIVGINDGVPSTPQAPFGGVKQSGIGREGGRWGIEE